MKKTIIIYPLLLTVVASIGVAIAKSRESTEVKASSSPTSGSTLPSTINLNDNTDAEIRNYYADLTAKSASERTGTNILKNLKPILQNFTYYSYDTVWKIYEITDREWALSPAENTTYGTYNANTKTITNYSYGANGSPKNDPYVHTLYRNRDENGVTISSGRIKEWGSHTQTGGTNREHVWCQSRGFKASSGASGPAGTDVHHLISGDGYVNGTPHNNNPYGYVDPNNITIDSKNSYSYCAGNIAGSPLHSSPKDESSVVFEPQDSDKGDIARACFYMVACYNNLSGKDTITQFNPNLTLADYATDSGTSVISSATKPVAMGILSDLLEWNKIDPVDEYEIHRNNLIYNNYQHNRNPFVDFPQWADYIWGDKAGTAVNPATDAINYGYDGEEETVSVTGISLSPTSTTISENEVKQLSATISPENATNKNITWTSSNENKVTVSNSGAITGIQAGSAVITARTSDGGYTATCSVTVEEESSGSGDGSAELYSGAITEGDYVIYFSGKALKNSVSSSRFDYAEVTPVNNKISNPADSIVWHIAPSSTYWTIYNSAVSKYAAGNGTKNQGTLISTATDYALWSVGGTSTYEFENKGNKANSVNYTLRNNGTYGFACYSDQTGGALSLYKISPIAATLSSISTTGQTTEFEYNDTFVYDGTLTATYSDSSTKTVIPTSVSSPDMSVAGEKTITVTYTEGGITKTCTYTITVNPEPVAVTGVVLSSNSISVEEDNTYTLTAAVLPNDASNKSINWFSHDDSIATVDNGVVTGMAPGETTITVITEEGDFVDSCTVTVESKERLLTANTYGTEGLTGAGYSPSNISAAYPLPEGLSWGSHSTIYGYAYQNDTGLQTAYTLRLGSQSVAGIVNLNLDLENAYISRVVINARRYTNNTVTDDATLVVNDEEYTTALTSEFDDYEFTYNDTSITSVKITTTGPTERVRAYIAAIDVYYKLKGANQPDIAIEEDSYSVFEGSTGTIDYETFNAESGTVTFESSNKQILSVDNSGHYTAIKKGAVNVTAKLTINTKTYTDAVRVMVNGNATITEVNDISESIGTGVTTEYKITVSGTFVSKSGGGTSSTSNSLNITDGENNLLVYIGRNDVACWNDLVEDAYITVTGPVQNYKGTPEIVSPVIEVGYTASNFANDLLAAISPICSDYDDVTSNKTALQSVWSTLSNSSHYGRLSAAEIAILASADADEDGTNIERAMAFYDYACKKYNLDQFITGRTISSNKLYTLEDNSNTTAMMALIALVAGTTISISLIYYLRKRKKQ